MPTIEEILNASLGLESQQQVKTATAVNEEDDEIMKLAAEIGLVGDTKTGPSSQTQTETTKEAHSMSLSDLYTQAFPDDADFQKSASVEGEEKVAAEYESALGARTFDHFSGRVDVCLTKLAEAAISTDSGEPSQTLPNNKKGGNDSIDTTPQVDNELPAENGGSVVGHEEQRSVKQAALRKYLLLSQLEE